MNDKTPNNANNANNENNENGKNNIVVKFPTLVSEISKSLLASTIKGYKLVAFTREVNGENVVFVNEFDPNKGNKKPVFVNEKSPNNGPANLRVFRGN